MLNESSEKELSAPFSTSCPLCRGRGELLYHGLQDSLFFTPGKWNLLRCVNRGCGLIWLDPPPSKEDTAKFYITYFTHPSEVKERFYLLRWLASKGFWKCIDLLMYPTSLNKDRLRLYNMYLTDITPGKLLEVGCGNGTFLHRMESQGWEVEGIELDPAAVTVAKAKFNLDVRLGILEEVNYHDESFDVITMNHVIEHVHEPIVLLKECHRILKKDGLLIVTTPNAESFGHKRFGQNWLGLDPPRHLHVFSANNINTIAEQSGFLRNKVFTTTARAREFGVSSISIKFARKQQNNILLNYIRKALESAIFQIQAFSHWKKAKDSGEEIVLMARR